MVTWNVIQVFVFSLQLFSVTALNYYFGASGKLGKTIGKLYFYAFYN